MSRRRRAWVFARLARTLRPRESQHVDVPRGPTPCCQRPEAADERQRRRGAAPPARLPQTRRRLKPRPPRGGREGRGGRGLRYAASQRRGRGRASPRRTRVAHGNSVLGGPRKECGRRWASVCLTRVGTAAPGRVRGQSRSGPTGACEPHGGRGRTLAGLRRVPVGRRSTPRRLSRAGAKQRMGGRRPCLTGARGPAGTSHWHCVRAGDGRVTRGRGRRHPPSREPRPESTKMALHVCGRLTTHRLGLTDHEKSDELIGSTPGRRHSTKPLTGSPGNCRRPLKRRKPEKTPQLRAA